MGVPPIRVTFVDVLPDGRSGTYAAYLDLPHSPEGWTPVDIREICRAHQKEWSAALTAWHCRLNALAGSTDPWAWLLPGSRLHLWQSPIRPVFFALGLSAYLRTLPRGELFVLGGPPELSIYLSEFAGLGVAIRDNRRPANRIRLTVREVSARVQAVVATARRWRPFVSKTAAKRADLVLFSLCLSADSVRQAGDHYFGRSFETTNSRVHWLHQVPGRADIALQEAALKETGRHYSLDFRELSVRDLVWCMGVAGRLRRRMIRLRSAVPALLVDRSVSHAFARRFFDELFVAPLPLAELSLYRAARRVMRATVPKAICFPYEEKGAERALIIAAHAVSPRPTVIGFAHAAYNRAFLYLANFPDVMCVPPRPDVIAAAGTGFGSWLRDEWGRTDAVFTVGSPRYVSASSESAPRERGVPLRVLALTGIGSELFVLRKWLRQCPDLLDGCQMVVRPHPHGWHREHVMAAEELSGLRGLTLDSTRSLAAQLDSSDLVLYCSTSAVAEAIQRGRLVAYVAWDDLWCSDPVRSTSTAICRCQSPGDLRALFDNVASMSASALHATIERQRPLASEIYSPFDPMAFDSLVGDSR